MTLFIVCVRLKMLSKFKRIRANDRQHNTAFQRLDHVSRKPVKKINISSYLKDKNSHGVNRVLLYYLQQLNYMFRYDLPITQYLNGDLVFVNPLRFHALISCRKLL